MPLKKARAGQSGWAGPRCLSPDSGADVGDRREQGALPEVVGLPPGGLIKQVRFGPAMEGAPLLRPALRTRASRLVDRGGGGPSRRRDHYAELLPLRERVLGPEHPATLADPARARPLDRQGGRCPSTA